MTEPTTIALIGLAGAVIGSERNPLLRKSNEVLFNVCCEGESM
jgi:hypothetical protein